MSARKEKWPVLITNHEDGVSGTTVLSDGSKYFWTEGRSSDVYAVMPNGDWRVWDASDPICPLNEGAFDPWGAAGDPDERTAIRDMTECEAHEWFVARYGRKR